MIYSTSLACANPLNLESDAAELIRAGHSTFHVDIMDGNYVPNLCLNLDVVRALKKKFDCHIDAHLMVENPGVYVELCRQAGVDQLAFHLDRVSYPYRLIEQIKRSGMKAGIALNPRERVEELNGLEEQMDYCLVMSIEPGFAGQKFMDFTYEKIAAVHQIRREKHLSFGISVDGGIGVEEGRRCRQLGADTLVMGMFSFFGQGVSVYDACDRYVRQVEGQPSKSRQQS